MTKINVIEQDNGDFLRDYRKRNSKVAKAVNWQERFEELQWQEDKCLEKLLYLIDRKSKMHPLFCYEDIKEIFDKGVQIREGKGLEMECAIELFVVKEGSKSEEYFFHQYQGGDPAPLGHDRPDGGYKNISAMVRCTKKFMQKIGTNNKTGRILSKKYGIRFMPVFYTIVKERLQEPATKEEIQKRSQELKDEKKQLIETGILDEMGLIQKLVLNYYSRYINKCRIENMKIAHFDRGLNRQEIEEFERLYVGVK